MAAYGSPSTRPSASSSTRSASPVKRIGDLQLSEMPVHLVDLDDHEQPPSPASLKLLSEVRRNTRGVGLIPRFLKEKAKSLIDSYKLSDHNFQPQDSNTPNQLKEQTTWNLVGVIVEEAAICKKNLVSESSWNAEVHCRILRLALTGWDRHSQLWYMDMTTARIHGSPTKKMVDYAICLSPDLQLRRAIVARLRSELDAPSINHTKAEYVRFSPIAISLETKRPRTDEDGANVQLGVWSAAHFTRLAQLELKVFHSYHKSWSKGMTGC